jgi:hypothetical protein
LGIGGVLGGVLCLHLQTLLGDGRLGSLVDGRLCAVLEAGDFGDQGLDEFL